MRVVTIAYSTLSQVRARIGLSTNEISDSDLTICQSDADTEIELESGKKFTSGNSQTDTLGPFPLDIYKNPRRNFQLKKYPIQTVTSVQLLNTDLTVSLTLLSTDYWIDNNFGKLTFKSYVGYTYPQSLKVVYTYGYSAVPQEITILSELLTGIRAWIRFLGGKYGTLNSYSIPEQSVDRGDLYKRGQMQIDFLTAEAERIWKRVGRRPATLVTTGGYETSTGVLGLSTNITGGYYQ